MSRTDSASRLIEATPETIYAAMTEEKAMLAWLPPKGMHGEMVEFDMRPGGHYRLMLHYEDGAVPGKTGEGSDDARVRIVDLIPRALVAQEVDFISDDAAFSGTMAMNWILQAMAEGTQVTIRAENVPDGISEPDHQEGLQSSLENLARYVEG